MERAMHTPPSRPRGMQFTRHGRFGVGSLSPTRIGAICFVLASLFVAGLLSLANVSASAGAQNDGFEIGKNELRVMQEAGLPPEVLGRLDSTGYVVHEARLAILAQQIGPHLADEMRRRHGGLPFASAQELQNALAALGDDRMTSVRTQKAAAALFRRSLMNEWVATEEAFRTRLRDAGIPEENHDFITALARQDRGRASEAFRLPVLHRSTVFYGVSAVAFVTVALAFNAMLALALMSSRALWPGLHRVALYTRAALPLVVYLLVWKWLVWDHGALGALVAFFAMEPPNWLVDMPYNAWTMLALAHGGAGAVIGVILFSTVRRANELAMPDNFRIGPKARWLQAIPAALMQMRWPILCVTAYEVLSLQASFALALHRGDVDAGLGVALSLFAIALAASLLYARRAETEIRKSAAPNSA